MVREILTTYADLRVQMATLRALQEAAEMYMVQFFEDALLCVLHRNRVTLTEKDLRLVTSLRPSNDPGKL